MGPRPSALLFMTSRLASDTIRVSSSARSPKEGLDMILRLLAAVLVAGVASAACSGGGSEKAPPSSAAAQAPATAAAARAGTAEFGVPECDEYITKYLA